jgi:uncharacterized protein YggE
VIAAENAARLEACCRAATTARAKAQAYADALGLRLGSLVEGAEPGTQRSGTQGTDFGARHSRAMRFDVVTEEPEIRVDPGQLDVRAAVELTYALEAS